MRHTYTEEEKELIANLVFSWLEEHDCSCGEYACQNDSCNLDAILLVSDLADIKDVTEE